MRDEKLLGWRFQMLLATIFIEDRSFDGLLNLILLLLEFLGQHGRFGGLGEEMDINAAVVSFPSKGWNGDYKFRTSPGFRITSL